jgi:hypothetical protein
MLKIFNSKNKQINILVKKLFFLKKKKKKKNFFHQIIKFYKTH